MIAVKFLRAWFFLLPFAADEYNYDNPNSWIEKYPTCAGRWQSPISLHFKRFYVNIPPLSFHYYDVPLAQPVNVTNNGHTVEAAIKSTIDGNRPSISGGGLNDVYEAVNVHFHWGSPNRKGSEHSIEKTKFDMEMHIVHKNSKYKTIEEALEDPYGLVVLGIFFKGVQNGSVNRSGLNEIYDVLPSLSEYNSVKGINKAITMQSILSDLDTTKFFRYRGSLTTPPCAEVVTWFVFSDILPINTEDLYRFFTLFDSRGVPLLNNFRPIQTSIWPRRVFFRKGKASYQQ